MAMRSGRTAGAITRTAFFNVATAGTAAIGGVIIARAVGPTVRGEYSAVTSWLGMLLILGEVGQPAAVCYYVASDPRRAQSYVATSRGLTLITGVPALICGLVAAPLLAHGMPQLADAYRLAFAGATIGLVGASCTFSLQARSISHWNLVRLSQPLLALTGIALLWAFGRLSLHNAIVLLIVTMAIQVSYAYYWCLRCTLAPGQFRPALVRPLMKYGMGQFTAAAPATANAYLDQLVLSQVVAPASLGRYSLAVSVTMIPLPLVSAIGNVAFPKLAARRATSSGDVRLQRAAILTSAGLAGAILLPLAVSAYWLIPLVFGPGYTGSVPLVWLLTPGGVFLACGQVTGDVLRGLGRPGLVGKAQGLAAIFTVIILVSLVPVAGVAAAAIASTVAYGVALTVMVRALWHSTAALPPDPPSARSARRPQHRRTRSSRRGVPSQPNLGAGHQRKEQSCESE